MKNTLNSDNQSVKDNGNDENDELSTQNHNTLRSNSSSHHNITDILRNVNDSGSEEEEEEDISSMDNAPSTTNADVESINSDDKTHEDLNENSGSQFYNNSTLSAPSQHNSSSQTQQPLNLDIQIELEVVYQGNLRLTVMTELILNKPTPAFMTLPIKLALKGISFRGKL